MRQRSKLSHRGANRVMIYVANQSRSDCRHDIFQIELSRQRYWSEFPGGRVVRAEWLQHGFRALRDSMRNRIAGIENQKIIGLLKPSDVFLGRYIRVK